MGSHEESLRKLRKSVLDSPGVIDPERRRQIYLGEPAEPRLDRFLADVRTQPASLGRPDIVRLREAGLSEDEILEATLAAALGSADRVLQAGLKALKGT